jgi:hypothetical protein
MIWALVLTTAFAGVVPILLPVPVSEPTQIAYDKVASLGPNDLVLMAPDFAAGAYASVGPTGIVMAKHLKQQGAKIMFVSSYRPDGAPMAQEIAAKAGLENYGTDYVILGYVPGEEAFVAAIAKDFRGNVKTDLHGTPISNIPLLKNVQGPKDFSLVITLTSSECAVWWIRQWNIPYGTEVIAACTGAVTGGILPYYPDKGLIAILDDVAGSGQYEFLTSLPGRATIMLGMQNITHIWMIFWMILGNIALIAGGGKK